MLGTNVTGLPRIGTERQTAFRRVFKTIQRYAIKPPGKIIDGTKSRDAGNTGNLDVLRAGLLMGKVTSGGKYAPAILGTLTQAYNGTGTSMTVAAATAVELVRRIGTTGTFKVTGPPSAAGVVATITVTYSAVNTTTGVITITALSVNAVHTLGFTSSPAGTFRLRMTDLSGVRRTTGPITYSGTAATLVSNINTALDACFGAGLLVASGSAVTAIAITFSGAGYLGLPQTLTIVDSDGLTAGLVSVTDTTVGVDGRMISGAFLGDTDGSHVPVTPIPDGTGIRVTDADFSTAIDQPFPQFPEAGEIESAQLVNWPSDTSLRAWIVSSLNTSGQGFFSFDHLT